MSNRYGFEETQVSFDVEFSETTKIGGDIDPAVIERLISEYLEKSRPKISTVTLLASEWIADNEEEEDVTKKKWHQVVAVDGVTENSQVDLTPSGEQLESFYYKDVALVAENDGGVVTVRLIGQKLENDYAMQVTITEVEYE